MITPPADPTLITDPATPTSALHSIVEDKLQKTLKKQLDDGDPAALATAFTHLERFGPLPPDLARETSNLMFAKTKEKVLSHIQGRLKKWEGLIQAVEECYGRDWITQDSLDKRYEYWFSLQGDLLEKAMALDKLATQFVALWENRLWSLYDSIYIAEAYSPNQRKLWVYHWDGSYTTTGSPVG